MKTYKKILIAVCALALVAAIIIGVVYVTRLHDVPELEQEKQLENPINYGYSYVVGQPPYSDQYVFDTPIGMNSYWIEYHNNGNGLEIVLQQSKDDALVVLSEALPCKSNAVDLYGKDVSVNSLTLEELRKINLAYYLTDEDGLNPYAGLPEEKLPQVSFMTCEEMLDYFDAPNKVTARLYLRFYDESQIDDLDAALGAVSDAVTAHNLTETVVFLPKSAAAAAAADKYEGLKRAATNAEAKALFRDCMNGKTPDTLPYSAIYEHVNGQFGSEKFIHYASNLGLAVVLSGVSQNDAAKYHSYGVTGIATNDVSTFIQILKDAQKAERESKKAAN